MTHRKMAVALVAAGARARRLLVGRAPAPTAAAQVPTPASSSSSGSPRPSSPATTPPWTRATTRTRASTSRSCSAGRHQRGRRSSRPAAPISASTWVPSMLASREGGTDLVDHRPDLPALGHAEASFKAEGHHQAADLKGKKIGSWLGGNEPELFAALTKAGLDPDKDATIVKQNFDMSGLLKGDLDAAQAMIYNEYAQVLEAKNPATGQALPAGRSQHHRLQRPAVARRCSRTTIFATRRVAEDGQRAIADKFLRPRTRAGSTAATTPECVDIVLKDSPARREPSGLAAERGQRAYLAVPERHRDARPGRVGPDRPDRDDVQGPEGGADRRAFRDDLARRRSRPRCGVDTKGTTWQKATVTLNEEGN